MDADGLPLIGMNIDLNKVEAIPAKRTLAFLNHFVTHTVAFLNRFAVVCEEKLESLTVRIERLETTMFILEAKLLSIPGLETVTLAPSSTSQSSSAAPAAAPPLTSTPTSDTASSTHRAPPTATVSSSPSDVQNISTSQDTTSGGGEGSGDLVVDNSPKVTDDPQYAKYRQLLRMGVPLAAFRQKLLAEGLDPNVLEALNLSGGPPSSSSPGGSTAPSTPAAQLAAVTSQAAEADKNTSKNSVGDDFSDEEEQSNSSNDEEVISDFDD